MNESEMASNAIAKLGSESTITKRSVGDVAIDGITTRGGNADPLGTSTTSAK